MAFSGIGLRDALFLVGALLGFASAFIIPPRGRKALAGGRVILLMGAVILSLAAILLILTLTSESDLRWWINTFGLLLLGGIVLAGWKKTQVTASPVVTGVVPAEGGTPGEGTPGAAEASTPGPVKVACPSCGTVITVEAGQSWIKCPNCGTEGKLGM